MTLPIATMQVLPLALAVLFGTAAACSLTKDRQAWNLMSGEILAGFACVWGHEPRLAWAFLASALFDLHVALNPERRRSLAYTLARAAAVTGAAWPLGPFAAAPALAWGALAGLSRTLPHLAGSKALSVAGHVAVAALAAAAGHHTAPLWVLPLALAATVSVALIWSTRTIGHVDERITAEGWAWRLPRLRRDTLNAPVTGIWADPTRTGGTPT